VYGIALLTLKIGLIATRVRLRLGIPGVSCRDEAVLGRRAALHGRQHRPAFPTVVVACCSRLALPARPVGRPRMALHLAGDLVGDIVLAFPIAAALAAAASRGSDPRIRRTAETLGAGRWRTAWTVAREARFALAA